MPRPERITAAIVHAVNGAYLISLMDPTNDMEPDGLYSAASSLRRAKNAAVEMARSSGFLGAFKWEQESGYYVLTARWMEDSDD